MRLLRLLRQRRDAGAYLLPSLKRPAVLVLMPLIPFPYLDVHAELLLAALQVLVLPLLVLPDLLFAAALKPFTSAARVA